MIKFRMNTPINFQSVMKIGHTTNKECTMKLLDELPAKTTTKDLFPPGVKFCMLYCTRYDHSGHEIASHWVLLLKRSSRVEIFEPLGNRLLTLVNKLGPIKSPGIRYWLTNSSTLESPYKFQSDNSQECGDWCGLRVALSHLTQRQFRGFINSSHIDRESLLSLLVFLPLFHGTREYMSPKQKEQK